MNYYFQLFNDINQSIDQVITAEYNSPEIKQSATHLNKSLQPCIEELQRSASKLDKLILKCSYDLDNAENIWLSKPRVAEADKSQIWEQIGEISGHSVRISNLGKQLKQETLEKSQKSWEQAIEVLKKKWFVDGNGNLKKGVGWGEKEGFTRGLNTFVSEQTLETDRLINNGLKKIYKQITLIQVEVIESHLSLLNNEDRGELTKQLHLINQDLLSKFDVNHRDFMPNGVVRLGTAIRADLNPLADKVFGDILWTEVIVFKLKVDLKILNYITAIFDDRIKLATQALGKAIAFYNYFLELQERYQQETPEQRQTEKAWIEQQRQQLEQVKEGIELIL